MKYLKLFENFIRYNGPEIENLIGGKDIIYFDDKDIQLFKKLNKYEFGQGLMFVEIHDNKNYNYLQIIFSNCKDLKIFKTTDEYYLVSYDKYSYYYMLDQFYELKQFVDKIIKYIESGSKEDF